MQLDLLSVQLPYSDFKFKKDLFENPYRDVNVAVELCASAEWAANPTEIQLMKICVLLAVPMKLS